MNSKLSLQYYKGGDAMNVCDFGTVLRQLRKNHNLTQEELGKQIGVSKAVVSKYENGLGYPTFDMLIGISDYFGVTTDYLLGVSKNRTIDVSTLTETQIDAVYQIISEFHKSNTK